MIQTKMVSVNSHFEMSIKSILNRFLVQMSRSSVVDITYRLFAKMRLAKYSATIHLDFKD